jgi:hypothetical protein
MKLIYFDMLDNKKVIYLTDIELKDFLKYIGLDKEIEITVFLGHKGNKYYYQSDMPQKLPVNHLLSFLIENEIENIEIIYFNVNGLNIEITDCYSYHLEGEKINETFLREIVLHFVGFSIQTGKELFELQNKYLVIEQGKIVAMFDNFNDYLQSGYSS